MSSHGGEGEKIIKMKFIIAYIQNSAQYMIFPSTAGNKSFFSCFNVEIYTAIFMIIMLDKLLSIKVHHALNNNVIVWDFVHYFFDKWNF